MNNLIKKINELGGVKPQINQSTLEKYNPDFSSLERRIGRIFPEAFKRFHLHFGAFSFKNEVEVEVMEENPVTEDNVSVDYFYGIGTKDYSVEEVLNLGLLPEGLYPICDGESGDYICLSLEQDENFGKIYYWYHEGHTNNDKFLIAEIFEQFILKLTLKKASEDSPNMDKIKVNASPELLEMLKKSGFGPK